MLFCNIRAKLLPALLLIGCGQVLLAQEIAQQPENENLRYIREFPARAGVNLHSYEFDPVYDTPAPKGYKPFYISHYGRHGSRSTSSDKTYLSIKKKFEPAAAKGDLTPEGIRVLEAAKKAIECHNGMEGRLTPRGRREHATIAERMYHRYPEVFKKGCKKIFAASSTVPRCLVSMNAFTNKLMSLQKDLQIDIDTGEKYMEYIGRGEGSKMREIAKPVTDSLWHTYAVDSTTYLSTLFKDSVTARKYIVKAYRTERGIFDLAKIMEAFDIDENLFSVLPEDVVYQIAERNSLHIYLHQANSARFGDIRMKRPKMLADDIISRADDVISGKAQRAADLRFGHDWPLMGLMAYFGLEGASEKLSIDEARGHWFATRYIPFAGNLQLIFYRNKKNDILVKFLINEKETLIPALTPVQGPYYRWEDVKQSLE